MFRLELHDFRLGGARPSCRPGVEVLEERIVLTAAPARPAILAERAQALAAVDPSAAAQQVVNTIEATLQQGGLLQQQLLTLASGMVRPPPGGARQGFVNRAVALVNRFVKQEKKRFKQFVAIENAVAGSPIFTALTQLYQQIHKDFLSIKSTVPGVFRLLSKASFRPFASQRAVPLTAAKGSRLAGSRLQIRLDASGLTGESLALTLTFLLTGFQGALTKLSTTNNPCEAFAGVTLLHTLGTLIDFAQAILLSNESELSTAEFNDAVGAIDKLVDVYNAAVHNVKAVTSANPPITHS
jgi:hypothetical protein